MKIRIKQWWGKLPITLKGVLIAGVFVIAAALIGAAATLLAPFIGTNNPLEPHCAYPPVISSDELQIQWLINQEGDALVAEYIDMIKQIFDPNAVIIDELSGEKWIDPVARYTNLFSATAYLHANHSAIQIKIPIQNNRAVFTAASDGEYQTRADGKIYYYVNPPGSDEWTVEKKGGCWVVTQFRFNVGH
jgi:hypothetical protein